MSWESKDVQEVIESTRNEKDYGSVSTLMFGVMMAWFFVVTFIFLRDFAVRSYLEYYFEGHVVEVLLILGYGLCLVQGVLVVRSFYVYFREPAGVRGAGIRGYFEVPHTWRFLNGGDRSEVECGVLGSFRSPVASGRRKSVKGSGNTGSPGTDAGDMSGGRLGIKYSPKVLAVSPSGASPSHLLQSIVCSDSYAVGNGASSLFYGGSGFDSSCEFSPTSRAMDLGRSMLWSKDVTLSLAGSTPTDASSFEKWNEPVMGSTPTDALLFGRQNEYMVGSTPMDVYPSEGQWGITIDEQRLGEGDLKDLSMRLPRYESMVSSSRVKPLNESSGMEEEGVLAFYFELGVDVTRLDEWAEDMRLWVARRLFREGMGWMRGAMDMWEQQPQQPGANAGRVRLDRWMMDFGNNREYVMSRIFDLSAAGFGEYTWDGGGAGWIPELPADAFVVARLFCHYMDDYLWYLDPAHRLDLFSAEYFKEFHRPTDRYFRVALYEKKCNPPHYDLVYRGREYALNPGRNNLFIAIWLLVFIVKKKHSGLVGSASLAASGLLDLVPGE